MDLPHEHIILFTQNKTGLAGTIYKLHEFTANTIKMNERKDYTKSQFFTCLLKEEGYYYWYLGLGYPKPCKTHGCWFASCTYRAHCNYRKQQTTYTGHTHRNGPAAYDALASHHSCTGCN